MAGEVGMRLVNVVGLVSGESVWPGGGVTMGYGKDAG